MRRCKGKSRAKLQSREAEKVKTEEKLRAKAKGAREGAEKGEKHGKGKRRTRRREDANWREEGQKACLSRRREAAKEKQGKGKERRRRVKMCLARSREWEALQRQGKAKLEGACGKSCGASSRGRWGQTSKWFTASGEEVGRQHRCGLTRAGGSWVADIEKAQGQGMESGAKHPSGVFASDLERVANIDFSCRVWGGARKNAWATKKKRRRQGCFFEEALFLAGGASLVLRVCRKNQGRRGCFFARI